MHDITVYVVEYGKGRNLMMRYHDPGSGKLVARSTGTRNRTQAERAAAKWEAELREGRYAKKNRMAWADFRQHYDESVLETLSKSGAVTYYATFNVFERKCSPQKLADVTTAKVTAFATALREDGAAEATIARHLRALKAATRWAHRQGLLSAVPQFTMPRRAKGMKVMRGRPITTEEFERMLEAVPKVVENAAADSWRFYLRGLWESSLRLRESLNLRWDYAPDSIVVDLSGRRPMLSIPSEAQKKNSDTLLPITPQFAELLGSVPECERSGRVFKLLGVNGKPIRGDRCFVGKVVSAIGKAAGVVVDERKKRGKLVRKFASAHDLRRSFGQRWSLKVMPTVLRELMRHESIETTMKFYVGRNAEATADAIWSSYQSRPSIEANSPGQTTRQKLPVEYPDPQL